MIDVAQFALEFNLHGLDRASALEALARYLDSQGGLTFLMGLDSPRCWLSSAWSRRFGGTAEQFAREARGLVRYIHPEDHHRGEEFVRLIDARVGQPNPMALPPVRLEVRLRTADGQFSWFEVQCNVIESTDGSKYIVGSVQDASALHEANDDLAARTVAEVETNRATAAFVSKMSHELRTPLHAILGYAQLLEMGAGDPADYLGRIRRAGDHLVQLLDDLLDFSRMTAARLTVADEELVVGPTIDAAIDMVSSLAAAHEVHIEPPAPATHVVRADATRLRQVLVNLLANAVKYNRPGGSVRVHTEVLDEHQVLIEVSDTGPGIEPELLPRLFVPFDRLGAESSNVSGAGLGLLLTRGLVQAMGGAIEVSSTPGQGSTFRVLLRRAGVDAPTETRHVVCIDDDPDSRRILEQLLSGLPASQVHAVGSAARGMQVLAEVQPSLIVLDRHLPGQDPAVYLQAVARLAPGCPVVMVSSDLEVLAPGFVQPPLIAAFSKPLDLEMFVDVVARTWSMRPA